MTLKKHHKDFLLFASMIINTIRISTSTATIEIQLLRYNVSNGLLNTKKCCDSGATTNCPTNQCDPYFNICLQDFPHISGCPLGNVSTDFTPNADHITFKNSVGSMNNKFSFHVKEYKGVILKLNVYDEDISEGQTDDERLDYLQYVYSQPADIHASNTTYHDIFLRGQVSTLDLRVEIHCDIDYYGTSCTNHCLSDANYYCLKSGERICRWVSCDGVSTILTTSTLVPTTTVSQTRGATPTTPSTTTTQTSSMSTLNISRRTSPSSGIGAHGTTTSTTSPVTSSVAIPDIKTSVSAVQMTSSQPETHKVTSKVAIIAGTVSSLALVSGLSGIFFFMYRRFCRRSQINDSSNLEADQSNTDTPRPTHSDVPMTR